jgi:hypothetical protein
MVADTVGNAMESGAAIPRGRFKNGAAHADLLTYRSTPTRWSAFGKFDRPPAHHHTRKMT